MNKTMTNKVRAAGALGLSYWADHPAPACIWAVDGKHYYPCRIESKRRVYVLTWSSDCPDTSDLVSTSADFEAV